MSYARHLYDQLDSANRQISELKSERDILQRWKDEHMFVESQWDAQAVGKELGMVAGTDIRRNILPAIVQLKRERDELRTALSGRTVSCSQCNESAKQIEAMREAIKGAHEAIDLQIFVRGTRDDTVEILNQMQTALAKLKPFLP